MALSRRNMLLGMVVLVVGAGVIGASGAFTSVEADRTMDIETSGDNSALLQLTGDSEIASTETAQGTSDVDILTLTNSDINEDAVTRFNDAFTVTNTGNDDVELYIENTGPVDSDALDLQFDGSTIVGSAGSVTIGAGSGSAQIDVVIDTTGPLSQSDLPNSGTITIVAEDPDQLN